MITQHAWERGGRPFFFFFGTDIYILQTFFSEVHIYVVTRDHPILSHRWFSPSILFLDPLNYKQRGGFPTFSHSKCSSHPKCPYLYQVGQPFNCNLYVFFATKR